METCKAQKKKERVALFGYGKLGREILSLLPEHDFICSAVVKKTASDIETAPAQCSVVHNVHSLVSDNIDICIETALIEGIEERILWAIDHQKPILVATTGWESMRESILQKARDKNTSLVWSSNFSVGIWLFRKIVREAARYLRPPCDFDCALFEAHHKMKKDAPSGTLKSIYDDIHGLLPEKEEFFSASQPQESPKKEAVDIATLRVGSVPGTHMVWLDGKDETIQLTHTTRNRRTFASGILTAARLMKSHPGVWEFDELMDMQYPY